VVVHHASLASAEIRVFDAVPVTAPVRTLVDVARTSDPSLARQAATETVEQGLFSRRRLVAAVNADREGDRLHAVLGLGPSKACAS
jgi:hypothetical protein